jgi:putative PIN family toxin of toxin-antitoxin system
MRIVLDSNILLVAIGRKSLFKPIWEAFINGRYKLIVSDDIILEYEEILQQRSSEGVAEIIMEIIVESPEVIYQQIYYSWNMISQDPDDNKFFDIAVAGNADFLVTNDAHFNVVKQSLFPTVKVISANEFLELLKDQ